MRRLFLDGSKHATQTTTNRKVTGRHSFAVKATRARNRFMLPNINQPNNLLQGQSAEIERFIVFRFSHCLGKGIKSRIKSLGCSWNTLHHGWLCPLSKQQEVQQETEKSKLAYEVQTISLPMGMISSNPKIRGRESQLAILETQTYKDEEQLLKDVYQYDPSLRPEDFALQPSEESKSFYQIQCELDFHRRWTTLQGEKEKVKRTRGNLALKRRSR